MLLLKRLFDFYINASLHIGFAVLALTIITEISLQIPQQKNLHLIIFFGTIAGYNILKYVDAFSRNTNWFVQNRLISFVSILALVIAVYLFFNLPTHVQIAFIAIGTGVVFYPFLRKYGLLKMFFVSFFISAITVYIPKIMSTPNSFNFYLTLVQRFLIVVSLLVPFEISDSKTDHPSLRTLPQQFGISRTKFLGIVLVLSFLILEFFKTNSSYTILIISITTALFIYFSSVNKNKYYTSFWVESVPVFWWLLLVLFKT